MGTSVLISLVPEKLHLLYPKTLAGRFEISSEINQNVEVQAPPPFIRAPNYINVDEVRQMVSICLRLEVLTSPAQQQLSSPRSLASPVMTDNTSSLQTRMVRRSATPVLLGPNVKDDMTDEELGVIIESLTTRIENCLSTLVSNGLNQTGLGFRLTLW